MLPNLFVVTADDLLRHALARRIERELFVRVIEAPNLFNLPVIRGELVLAPSAELTAECCAYLIAGLGLRIAVLASIPNVSDQSRFGRLGVYYLPMTVGDSTLIQPLRDLLLTPVQDHRTRTVLPEGQFWS